LAPNLIGLATVACAIGQYEPAVRLLSTVAALLAARNYVLEPIDRSDFEQSMAAAKAYLDAMTFEQAWSAGKALPLDQAIAEAFALAAEAKSAIPISARSLPPAGLTPREVEVLRLIAYGMTNAQVAAQLVISPRTVHTHLGSIYHKLKTSSRALAIRFAVEHG